MKLGEYETNTIYNEDCFEAIKKLPDKCIDLVIIDPPYEVTTTTGGGIINTVMKMNESLKELDDNNISNGYDIEQFAPEVVRVMKSINIYIFCNKAQIPKYLNVYVDKYGCKFDMICWHKTNPLPTYSNKYLSDTEYCLYFRKGKGKCFPQSYEDAKTFYIEPINLSDKKKYGHPTIKPLPLLQKLIRNSSNATEIVADFFIGSGTVAVGARAENRQFIGFEINPKWYEVANNRLQGIDGDGQYNFLAVQD